MQKNKKEDIDLDIISDEELSMFQDFELEDETIKQMEILNKDIFYKKINRDAIEKVKESLNEDEEIEFYFTGLDIQTSNVKTITTIFSRSGNLGSGEWGLNKTIVFTNKKIFIVQRNNMLEYLSHEEVTYENIKEIYLYKKNSVMEIRYKNNNKKQIDFQKEIFESIYKLAKKRVNVKAIKGEYLSLMDKFLRIYLILSLIGVLLFIIYY